MNLKTAIVKLIGTAYNSCNSDPDDAVPEFRVLADRVSSIPLARVPTRLPKLSLTNRDREYPIRKEPVEMPETSELTPNDGVQLDGMILQAEARPACCGWAARLAFPAVAMIAVLAICVSAFLAGTLYERSQATADPVSGVIDASELLPLIKANSAVTSEKFSMATGSIADNSDGLFLLDHNSGLLQCSVIYPRLGKFMGQFTVNVADALGIGRKGGTYMMVTGRADFPRSSNNPAASTVVYVLDTATGNYACYGVPFNRVAMNANRSQQGVMILLSTGTANPVLDRESLR